ncbi:hypothetical protein M2277_005069 [Paenibacillus sp. LBL]|uniref:hypothetical protein n=1 Tax=Paenibacillus sp. LBL TaxID=2940563 RepID=UPI002474A467|nr:hypothetical protein [Paenibacillus sp. LBL]MDH6674377.1 hypothetical protein [Paenibacillus sp. LBL]
MYTVTRINGTTYNITGEGVNVTVISYDPFSYSKAIDKATGKGSRTIKDELKNLIQEFVKEEEKQKEQALTDQATEFRNTIDWPSIKNKELYNVTLNYGYNHEGYEDRTKTSQKLMTGKDLKRHIRHNSVIGFEPEEMKHTNIYNLGRFIGSGISTAEWVKEEERVFVCMNGIRITGLTAKELLNEGRTSFYDIFKDNRDIKYIIEEARKASGQIKSLLGAIGEENQIIGIDMYSRFVKELERAEAITDCEVKDDETAVLEVYSKDKEKGFYYAEEPSGNLVAIDASAGYDLQPGRYYKCKNTGMAAEGEFIDLFIPLEEYKG